MEIKEIEISVLSKWLHFAFIFELTHIFLFPQFVWSFPRSIIFLLILSIHDAPHCRASIHYHCQSFTTFIHIFSPFPSLNQLLFPASAALRNLFLSLHHHQGNWFHAVRHLLTFLFLATSVMSPANELFLFFSSSCQLFSTRFLKSPSTFFFLSLPRLPFCSLISCLHHLSSSYLRHHNAVLLICIQKVIYSFSFFSYLTHSPLCLQRNSFLLHRHQTLTVLYTVFSSLFKSFSSPSRYPSILLFIFIFILPHLHLLFLFILLFIFSFILYFRFILFISFTSSIHPP